ncbi:MAG TPA: hypothetical protein VJX48_02875 [Xanthobacteraceae bacterium]|nr:hypothetical protein [Xanthobacteraceae bacterium]
MSDAEPGPLAAQSHGSRVSGSSSSPRAGFWIRELPYGLVFILTILGVAYTSYSKKPIMGYWELLAPLIALVCIGAGWRRASDKGARLRLIWTQALHWFAFLLVMTMLLLTDVQRVLSAGATGLAILTVLALGTFTAGVHVLSWQVCLLGLVMALGVPVIAWVEQSALIFVLIALVVAAIGAVLLWHWHENRQVSGS